MSWSWRIGRIAGIDVYIHFTFLLLLGWVGLSYYLAHREWEEVSTARWPKSSPGPRRSPEVH